MNCSCWFCQMAGASSALVNSDQAGLETNTALATLPVNSLISNELANFAKKVVKNDNVMDIYLQTTPSTVRVGGGSFGAQDINALAMAADLQQFIKDTFTRLDQLIDLDFRFITTKTNSDLDFYVDSDIEVGGSGTTLGIALSNSTSSRNWWELALNGPALQNQADYLRYATIHEFGHAMGLEHPFDNGDGDYYGSTNSGASAYPEDSVMSYRSPSGGSWPTWYSSNDIVALQKIWGVESTPVAAAPAADNASPVPLTPITPVTQVVPEIPITPVASINSAVYRFYNFQSGKHFYTASAGEKDILLGQFAYTFRYEGVAFNAPDQGDEALYRFCRAGTSQHLFTASSSERDALIANPNSGYVYEGSVCNVYSEAKAPLGATAVFSFFDSTSGQRFFTASSAERAAVASGVPGWKDEGAKFFV